MPLLTPRPDPNDGGYAVADYRTVRSDLGDVDELRDLATVLREQGISLCIDLVLNHTAREHAWAEAARAGDAEKRDYYLVFPDRDLPDQYEQSLPEVFPDFAPGSFTFDDDLAGWVWTTFNDYQWDLNWANPSVLCEFADILLGWANVGVEVFRLDAIAFLWKRLGTSCQNQPEVHDLTQALRTVARIAAPAVLFKAEAIVGPADLPAYLGTGAHAGKVSDLAYHNSLMVQVWSMLASGEVGLAAIALQNLPQPPSTTSWITYLRCHDDIGWAIDDTDAWRAGLNGFAHRRFLADWYAGAHPGSWARGLVFQENSTTGDRRISGSLASLAGRECHDPGAVARILLAHAVVLSFGGLPVIWMGDEVGLLNDRGWADEPTHAGDNRWAHRPRMPWPVPADTDGISDGLGHLLRRPRAAATAARRPPDGGLGPTRPRCPARRTPLARRPAARRRQHDRPAGSRPERGLLLAGDGRRRPVRPPDRRPPELRRRRHRAGAVRRGVADRWLSAEDSLRLGSSTSRDRRPAMGADPARPPRRRSTSNHTWPASSNRVPPLGPIRWIGVPTTRRDPSGAVNAVPAPFSTGSLGSSETKVRATCRVSEPSANVLRVQCSFRVVRVSIPHRSWMKSSKKVSCAEPRSITGAAAYAVPDGSAADRPATRRRTEACSAGQSVAHVVSSGLRVVARR